MNVTKLALAAAVSCGLMAADAWGQGLRQPASINSAALTSDYYRLGEEEGVRPSPSDRPVVPAAPAAPGVQKAGAGGCAVACDSSCGTGCKDVCQTWRLFPEVGCGWTATGWIAFGGTANGDNPGSNYNGPVVFNDREEFQFNQVYLTFGRDVDTGGCGWDWGARVDFLYGSDYIFTQAAGLELQPDGSNAWNGHIHYGLAMPQAYADIAYNNLTLRLGHFYTTIGYEVVKATGNFFYSHAYTHQYGEPFTHTGGLFTWDYSDRITLHGGLVNGWDKFDAVTDKLAFLGGATYTPSHERYSIAFALISGEEAGDTGIFGPRTMYSLILDYNISENLKYVLEHDHGWQDDAIRAGVDAEWYGINQYLLYTINDCWKAGARIEWFRDDDGYRLSSIPIRAGGGAMTAAQAAGNYYNITLGLNWLPTANLTVRPEVRWDWSDGTGGRPYDLNANLVGSKDSQFTGAVDLIWVF